jgi:diguanylate cyclase (GGDEF)-like protein
MKRAKWLEPQTHSLATGRDELSNGQTIKLLIVDDDEDDLYLITEALSEVTRTRYAVTTASSSLQAMVELAKGSFDVIFSDYRLGTYTGVDFINNVRGAGLDTPIILLTGISDHLVDNAALQAGSSDFIPKTAITADVLDRSVRYAMAHANRQKLLQSILKNTKSGICVRGADGNETLWNAQFSNFVSLTFGDAHGARRRLVELAYDSQQKDLTVGSIVLESHITSLPDGGSILTLHDVTDRVNDLKERQLAEERIRAIAMQDVLTGLPNRMAFNDYLDECLAKASQDGSNVGLLLFDFNRFKEVNDLFGHAAGDHILKQAASRIRDILQGEEFCARLGGDEFVLVQLNSTEDTALDLARRVEERLAMSLKWEDKTIEASVTLGVAFYPMHGNNRQALLANADLAMYRGKSELERTICIFDAGMDEYIRDRRTLAHDLRHAIQNNQLSLDLQPQFATKDGSLAGFEALLRWHCPTRGQVSPAKFIPIAEENGLIIEIDRWVLKHGCELLARYPWIPRLAVNISAKAICMPQVVCEVRDTLLEIGISPKRLELEVTETALVQDLNRALHNLRQIKALGIAIAMDDFGTGYSSLSLLSSFPFDRIKVDGSFIRLTGTNERADAIFKAVVSLGSALSVPVLAEGVETEAQITFAKESGCEELQGYNLGYPIPEALLEQLYRDFQDALSLSVFRMWQTQHLKCVPANLGIYSEQKRISV